MRISDTRLSLIFLTRAVGPRSKPGKRLGRTSHLREIDATDTPIHTDDFRYFTGRTMLRTPEAEPTRTRLLREAPPPSCTKTRTPGDLARHDSTRPTKD